MKISREETYHILLWWLKRNEEILWGPTHYDFNKPVFTDDETYSFLVISYNRIILTDYVVFPPIKTELSYSELTSCMI